MYIIRFRKENYIMKHMCSTLNNYLHYNTLVGRYKVIYKLKYNESKFSKVLNIYSLKFSSVQFLNKLYSTSKSYYDKLLYYKLPEVNEHREDIICDLCSKHESLSPVEWDSVKTEILKTFENVTTTNFDGLLMTVLLMKKNINRAKSFMNYLEIRKLKPNIATLSVFMALCSEHENIYEQDISKAYKKLQPMIGAILDANTAKNIIKGLSVTKQWKDSFSIINKLPDMQPTAQMQNFIACAALRNNEVDLAWQMMNNLVENGNCSNNKIYECYIEVASNLELYNVEEGNFLMEKLLNFLERHEIVINLSVAEKFKQYFQSNRGVKWKGLNTKLIKSNAKCIGCGRHLDSLDLSSDEFCKLREALYEKVIKKSDIFLNTTPEELVKYEKFLQKNKPFDIVVDGLNIAYMQRSKNSEHLASRLCSVVEHFVKNDKRVLVLGRKHMQKWPRKIMKIILDNSRTFFAENISEDDPFLLYATIYGGHKTLFVSKDMMRNHMYCLQDPDLQRLFQRWQKSHQIYLTHVTRTGEPKFEGPLKYDICIQGSMETGWHIPYDDGKTLGPYEMLNNWLCLQRISH